jgi:hypothetical protein
MLKVMAKNEYHRPGELESIVGSSYSGVLSSDDFTAYNGYAVTAQQKCQAHLPSPVTSRH